MLERPESVRTREADLASVILATPTRAPRRFEARSVLLLALVVGVLAAMVGVLAFRTGDDGSGAQPSVKSKPSSGASTKATSPGSTAPIGAAAATTSTPAGISLAIGRMTATVDAVTRRMVVRVDVTNLGSEALAGSSAAQLLLLVDDQVVGRQPLRTLAGRGARATHAFTLSNCRQGRHAVTAIADATSVARDAVGSNGARSRELMFDCPFD